MASIFQRILGVLTTGSYLQLRQQVQYLKLENQILRSKINDPVRVTKQEKAQLVRLAKPLGNVIKTLANIAKPATLLRWIRDSKKVKPRRVSRRKPGRPRTREDIRQLIIRMAQDTDWGYSRIRGELLKLRIKIGRGTIVNILKEAGLPTGPHRGEPTWREFIQSHAETLWACDFLRHRIVTSTGFNDVYLLMFVNVATRVAIATKSTLNPNQAWACNQVAYFEAVTRSAGHACKVLTRDSDTKFGKPFDDALTNYGITPVRLPVRSPNLNAHFERFIQSVQDECLHRFVVMGSQHLDHLISEYVDHYNTERPHMGIGHRVPTESKRTTLNLVPEVKPIGQMTCRTRLGGVLRTYWRIAA